MPIKSISLDTELSSTNGEKNYFPDALDNLASETLKFSETGTIGH